MAQRPIPDELPYYEERRKTVTKKKCKAEIQGSRRIPTENILTKSQYHKHRAKDNSPKSSCYILYLNQDKASICIKEWSPVTKDILQQSVHLSMFFCQKNSSKTTSYFPRNNH